MKIEILRSADRGLMVNSEFKGYSIFSNGQRNSGRREFFGAVYVFNDDFLFPKSHLGMHSHSNVEIVTFVIAGIESHNDTIGVHDDYVAGDAQLISSGAGLYHEGGNVSEKAVARHLQIWIVPRTINTRPEVTVRKRRVYPIVNNWQIVVSPDGQEGTLRINQDVWMFNGSFKEGESISYSSRENGNGMLLYVLRGEIGINGCNAKEGDTIFTTDSDLVVIKVVEETELFLIETVLYDHYV